MRGGRLAEATAEYEKTLEIAPDYAKARYNLGGALYRQGRIAEAIAQCSELVRLQPDNVMGLNQLARALATNGEASLRDGRRAVELAQRAARLTGNRDPDILDTLAAAYAEAGRFSEAVKSAEQALALATSQNNVALADALRVRIKLYRAESPYHDTQQPSGSKSIRP